MYTQDILTHILREKARHLRQERGFINDNYLLGLTV